MTDLQNFEPRRILVCQLRQLGDVILTTPALELLHRRFPNAEVDLFTEKKCVPLLENNPHVHKVWGLDKKALTPFTRELAWYWHVARSGYDLVVDFQQLPRCRWVVGFSGAEVRLSYTPPWYTRLLYTHWADPLDGYAAMCKASVLAPLGIVWNGEKPRLYLSEAERAHADSLLAFLGYAPGLTLISLDPTHRQATRRWGLSQYAELVCRLHAARPDLRFLPLWGPGEEDDIRRLSAAVPQSALLIPEKMLSLREMAACIAAASLHIGNCSAPRHMAAALDTPSLVIRGSTSDSWTFPDQSLHSTVALNLPCQPCNRNTCPHCDCLLNLTAEVVEKEVLKRISGGKNFL